MCARLREGDGLHVVLDASRDDRVFALLAASHVEFQSLYEGAQGEELADVAPYLVILPTDDRFLDDLVAEAWGDAWGVFLYAPGVSFRDLRRHLRRFLRVRDELTGKTLIFRWYDPRVLRAFLPSCDAAELAQFFGPVSRFALEGWEGDAFLRYSHSPRGLSVEDEALPVAPAP